MYPRATVKKIVKAHSNCNVSKNADVTVSWASRAPRRVLYEPARADLVMWRHRCSSIISSSCRRAQTHVPPTLYTISMTETIERLVKEAGIESKQAGERGITARSVKKVTGVREAIFHCRATRVKTADMISEFRTHSQNSRDEETLTKMSIYTLSQPERLVACPLEPS